MSLFSAVAATFLVRGVRLGPMRLTPYGLCAAVGLCLALVVAGRSAKRLGLSVEKITDAGMFALLACLIASRLLLVLTDPAAFLRYPWLVLSLPSLTIGGMALAGMLVFFHVRRSKLGSLRVLDAYSAPGAVLAALLELGHALDGSEPGMPTRLPWGIREPIGAGLRFHPVAAYGVLGSLLLAAVLWRFTASVLIPGQLAAWALVGGGALAFFLNTLTQPNLFFDQPWLEPGQFVALAAMLAGALLWTLLKPTAVRITGVGAEARGSLQPHPEAH